MIPKVSVIIPCYNVAEFLPRGIECLSRQTLSDIEIICINDGSIDQTLYVLQTLSMTDMRIKIIDLKKNGGVSAARNAGIKQATGEYIGFMDPDDFVDLNFYEKLYESAKKNNSDMVVANLKCHLYGFVRNKYREYIDRNPRWRSIKSVAANLFNFAGHFTAIYRNDLVRQNNLEYPVGFSNSEDHIFELKCVLAVHSKHGRYSVVEDVYYHHVRRLGSLNSHFFNMKQLDDLVKAVKYELKLINSTPGITERDYNLFMFPKIYYLTDGLLKRVTDQKSLDFIAENLIEIYQTMKYKEEIQRHDKTLFALLVSQNKEELSKYFFSLTRYSVRRYKLFAFITLISIFERYNSRTYKLFEYIPVWKVQF
ncbi:MAG: glycosyltransferase [Rickettsiales bacterium]|jgi:glycosyltransferase involved in cell wall biosynthesis|nr:glycosyltransferase [Rickettsiales bacterium]